MHLTTVVKSKCLLLDKYILFIVLSYSCLPPFLVKASPTFFSLVASPSKPFPSLQSSSLRRGETLLRQSSGNYQRAPAVRLRKYPTYLPVATQNAER